MQTPPHVSLARGERVPLLSGGTLPRPLRSQGPSIAMGVSVRVRRKTYSALFKNGKAFNRYDNGERLRKTEA
jgi:hypothetical protein